VESEIKRHCVIRGEEASEDSCSFESLSSEILGHVLSYCDFPSALRFARSISRSIRQDLYRGHHFLWKEVFDRHHFSLPSTAAVSTTTALSQKVHQHNENEKYENHTTPTTEIPAVDYLREIRLRRQLSRNLLMPKVSKNGKAGSHARNVCCFNLPNRCYSFVPVTPDGLYGEWDDPPPVDFGCDSFILTSPACGGEMLWLDPFHGTLSVYENCLDNAVASDEGMMEKAMLEAANLIDNMTDGYNERLSRDDDDEDMREEHIAGAAFESSVYRNHNMRQYKKGPLQVLFSLEEDIDLDACFPSSDVFGTGNIDNGMHMGISDIEVGYHGIDSKCIFKDHEAVGTMVAVGRMVTIERQDKEDLVCTELITWTRWNETMKDNPRFGERKICRFPLLFRNIDLCAAKNRVYVSFDASDGPLPRNGATVRACDVNAATIVVYQLVPHLGENRKNRTETRVSQTDSHQKPEFFIRCQGEVTALAVGPTGDTLVVGTAKGTCEVWEIRSSHNGATYGKRTSTVDIRESIKELEDSHCPETDSNRMRRTLLTILNRPKIVSFHHPSHCPLSTCGFVTLQHSSSDGSSLLLWRKLPGDAKTYKIVSMINLPLSGITRAPRVFYDGRRILVLGQDHIGLIILVYHVLSSNEDIHLFQDPSKEEMSGGVYNLTAPTRARFANRIRHAALGGLQYYESIHLTCNERFVVVNTKTGNFLSDSTSPYAEGLLVIDLQN